MTLSFLNVFSHYSQVLDDRYDKHEKIYKLSRDLTRESKKVIYALQRIPGCDEMEQNKIMDEAQKLLYRIRDTTINTIAILLKSEPLYIFFAAYSSGMEEYLEALLCFSFIKHGTVIKFEDTRRYINEIPLFSTANYSDITRINNQEEEVRSTSVLVEPPSSCNISEQLVTPDVFVLGLSDVSGELMRYYIKSVAVGEVHRCSNILHCLRQMKAGYRALGTPPSKSLTNKIIVHENNLAKVESICYNTSLRSTELSSDQLSDYLKQGVILTEQEDEDETES